MLTLRMQRTGRKGLPMYRMIVQDSRFSPTSGRIVANVGHYNPHTKEVKMDNAVIEKHLSNGAQPSPRFAKLAVENGVKMPKWFKPPTAFVSKIKNADKMRKNAPKAPTVEVAPEAEAAATVEPVTA
jgi:small subunit ribosomal protein S16